MGQKVEDAFLVRLKHLLVQLLRQPATSALGGNLVREILAIQKSLQASYPRNANPANPGPGIPVLLSETQLIYLAQLSEPQRSALRTQVELQQLSLLVDMMSKIMRDMHDTQKALAYNLR